MNDSGNSNIHDISDVRRQKKRQRNIQKFIGFMAVLVIALGLYVSRDRWIPQTNGTDPLSLGKEVSNGNFPLSVTNGIDYQSCPVGKGFALLSDTRLYIYSTDGELLDTRTNSYPNMVLKPGNSRVLLYEQGGSNFSIESRGKTIYEKEVENSIILASVSEAGYVAVVTDSDRYVCELRVFDSDGDEIYSRGCVERVMDVSFNADSSGCYIITVNAKEGKIVSTASSVLFSDTEDIWRSAPAETCCITSFSAGDNGLLILGDTSCVFLNSEGMKTYEYKYSGILRDFSIYNGKASLLLENRESRRMTLAVFSEPDLDPSEISLDGTVQSVYSDRDAVYVLGENTIEAYSYGGKLLKSEQTGDIFRDFYRMDKYIILLGYNKIDRIDFKIKK